ncbi:tigger transposable element-derived protein 4-like [Octopus sinensis]|uniref:Tigger transposable element-derived protein 4-like n=1 Tax=Octopus sinensis TaxID=2607531 RepID=A0A6P7TRD7_9MOLL|nr:tigger transposable element-derived protein 4-like [Octopus sinensis]
MRKCTRLTFIEKRRIIAYIDDNKHMTMEHIASVFSSVLKKISRRSINDLRLEKQKILDSDPLFSSKKRLFNLTYSTIDTEVMKWMEHLELRGGFMDDNSILLKAKKVADLHGITDFKASNGWLSKFKKRNNIKLRTFHGESYMTNVNFEEEINSFISVIFTKLQEYEPANIYNADETRIFYKNIPSKSV